MEEKQVLESMATVTIKPEYPPSEYCSSEPPPSARIDFNRHDTKILPNNLTRTACQQECLNEKASNANLSNLKINFSYNVPETNRSVGTCVLSDSDRHLMPNSYRVSTFDDEYFETNVQIQIMEPKIIALMRNTKNVILSHADLLYTQKTKEECQILCESFNRFNCRGFSIISGKTNNVCLLHSEDSKLHGPKLLEPSSDSKYYEKARCLNISVSCSESYMTIRYQPELEFRGKLYMQGNSENPQCFVWGQGKFNTITLKLPLLTSQCGIIKADSPTNRTLLAGTLVIQYNALIQTRSDRIIKVGCIFGNESKVLIGTGVKISSSLPNKGSTLLNTASNETVAPVVEMKVVDLRSQEETIDSQIGQELQMIIELKEKTNTYDLWASHLIAMTEKGDESIFLLDDRGCPPNLNIFPALKKETTNDTKKLTAIFQAFKFASSPVVRFSVIIQFCTDVCNPINCGNNIESYGRRKRAILTPVLETINGSTTIRSNGIKNKTYYNNYNSKSSVTNQMPLEYIMVVRNPNSYSDRLIVGDRDTKILVAGYNYKTDEVCMDYSLVIGLIITWIIVQLIFIICCIVLVRRYKKYYEEQYTRASMEELHKNFGIGFSNLENRRVHWADNGDNIM
ncbi:uncharacterized protein LOC115891723 [Sitophilus oryzae]|uniref:Uncharacterized protein LOC115891723 n=1 Tax=Sitophilus oryzae TaxID=7048 RepID=A0A6J2YXZ6_SITOR|nr:uncharacterized protein LOC115891723 [Sitophilus oryzae]